jgi:hypothetical protein
MDSQNEAPSSPSEVFSISAEDFAFAMQLGDAAFAFKMPMERPSKFGFNGELEKGTVQRFQLADHRLNRFGIAVRNHFGDDRVKAASFMHRWWAFRKMLESDCCKPYIRTEAEARDVHSSVFDVAASQQLNEDWNFDDGAFFGRVAELYALDPD